MRSHRRGAAEAVEGLGVAVDEKPADLADGVEREDAAVSLLEAEAALHVAGPRVGQRRFPHLLRHVWAEDLCADSRSSVISSKWEIGGRKEGPETRGDNYRSEPIGLGEGEGEEVLDGVDVLGLQPLVEDPVLPNPFQPPDFVRSSRRVVLLVRCRRRQKEGG